jgi:hypothetical protein
VLGLHGHRARFARHAVSALRAIAKCAIRCRNAKARAVLYGSVMQKNSKDRKPLELRQQTVKVLTTAQMKDIAGGMWNTFSYCDSEISCGATGGKACC